jgi:hypothetical protein
MKRTLLSIILTVIIFVAAIPMNAMAMEQPSNGETSITYTAGASWIINIPTSVNLNNDPRLNITAKDINLSYGQKVCIYIDSNSTYENGGNFYLYKSDVSTEKMLCNVYHSSVLISGLDYKVATFNYDGADMNEPIEFVPMGGKPGTYTGRIYFRIELE